MKKLILIGYAACGKSTVGAFVAQRLGWRLADTDAMLEDRTGLSVRQIFSEIGERGFRLLEEELLQRLVPVQGVVVSCGGGSVLLPQFEQLARSGKVVWLTAQPQTVISRLDGTRPLSDGKTPQQIALHMAERQLVYQRYADVSFATDDVSPLRLADDIVDWLHRTDN